jgi:hypothetical protein
MCSHILQYGIEPCAETGKVMFFFYAVKSDPVICDNWVCFEFVDNHQDALRQGAGLR